MTHIFKSIFLTTIVAFSASGALAQTTQKAVLGTSSDPVYSVQVEGANGVLYNCKPDLVQDADGRSARECVRASERTGTLFESGTGITNAGPAIALLVVAAAAVGGGGDSTTSSATNTGN